MTTTIDRHIERPPRAGTVTVNQYSRKAVIAIWAAAALMVTPCRSARRREWP